MKTVMSYFRKNQDTDLNYNNFHARLKLLFKSSSLSIPGSLKERRIFRAGKIFFLLLGCFALLTMGTKAQVLWGTSEYYIIRYDAPSNTVTTVTNPGGKTSPDLVVGADGKLYGTTINGGTAGLGFIFVFDPATSVATNLLDFDASANPVSVLKITAANKKIYATGAGGLYSFDPLSLNYILVDGAHSYGTGNLIEATDGKIYGVSAAGKLFSFNTATSTYILEDATDNFGQYIMQASNGLLYGVTEGAVYSYDINAHAYVEYPIDVNTTNGATNPVTKLVELPDGKLYGRTSQGGQNNAGVIFSFDLVTNAFNDIYDLDLSETLYGGLTAASNNKLYAIFLEGGNHSSFVWSLQNRAFIVDDNGDGQYSYTTLVEINTPPACNITGSIVAGGILCNGGTSTLTISAGGGTAPYTYSINGAAYQSSNLFTASAGNYNVTIKDALGCTKSLTPVSVTQPLPLSVTTRVEPVNKERARVIINATGGTAPYMYRYSDGPYKSTNTYTLSAGSYTFTVKDKNACTKRIQVKIIRPTPLTDGQVTSGKSQTMSNYFETSLALEIKAVPNPSPTTFTLDVKGNSTEAVIISVTDIMGRLIYEQKGMANKQYRLGKSFAKGTYFIQAIQGINRKTIKVIKE